MNGDMYFYILHLYNAILHYFVMHWWVTFHVNVLHIQCIMPLCSFYLTCVWRGMIGLTQKNRWNICMKINCSQILKFIFSQLNSNDKNVTISFMTNDVMSPAFPWGASQTVCVITTSLAATSEKCSQWLYDEWQIPEGNSGWQPRYNKFRWLNLLGTRWKQMNHYHFYTWWLFILI